MYPGAGALVWGGCFSAATWSRRGVMPWRAFAMCSLRCVMIAPFGALFARVAIVGRSVDLYADDITLSTLGP
eukprot:8670658-Pyramimonas_sp.AAC.1